MGKVYCGIDLGTSSVKAATFNQKFQLLNRESLSYQLYSSQKNQAELDPEEVYNETLKCLKNLHNKTTRDFKFISISSALHSLIAVDREYNPLTGCLTWADTRAMEFKDSLQDLYNEYNLYQKTGCPPHAMYYPAKILWINNYRPEVFSETEKFITIKEYILKKMTGEEYVDFSLASAGGLLNLRTKNWERTLLNYLNITPGHFGELVDAKKIVPTKPQVQDEINTDAPVIMGSGDGPLANLGAGAYRNNDYVVTIGSSGAIRIFSDNPVLDKEMRTWCYMLDKDVFLPGGAINNGGIVLDWLKNNLFLRDISNKQFYNELENILAEVPPGSGGLIFLPFLSGERSPNWKASARGILVGMSLEHKQEEIIKAAVEGILFRMYSVFEALKELKEEEGKIIASGGFTGSESWLQMLADVFDRKVISYEKYEASSAGAAMVGSLACGDFSNHGEIKPEFDIKTIKEPDKKTHEDYMEIYQKHKDIYEANSKFFGKL